MVQQTPVDWIVNKIYMVIPNEERNFLEGLREQANVMERERKKEDFKIGYNQGYLDAQCNHINDAENFANEQDYLNQ